MISFLYLFNQPQQVYFQLVMKSFLSKILYDIIHSQLHVHVDYLNIILYRQLEGATPVTCTSYSGSQTTLWLPLTQSAEQLDAKQRMNWKEYRKKQLWLYLWHYPSICPEGLGKAKNASNSWFLSQAVNLGPL